MPVPQPQKLHSLVRMALFCIPSTATTTEIRSAPRSARSEIYSKLPDSAQIAWSCSTGYGEALIKAALMLDEGEVETISHYYAAAFFDPEVDCILDIGGQDMKCIKIKNGTVDSVQLNEACSSGCGSFIETLRAVPELQCTGFCTRSTVRKTPDRSWYPLYRIYEFQGKTGTERSAHPLLIFPPDLPAPSSKTHYIR